MRACTCVCVCVCVLVCVPVHTYMHTHVHKYMHTYQARTHIHTHIYSQIKTHIHTNVYTHIYTHIPGKNTVRRTIDLMRSKGHGTGAKLIPKSQEFPNSCQVYFFQKSTLVIRSNGRGMCAPPHKVKNSRKFSARSKKDLISFLG